jgi:hypothetical protein
MSVAFIHVSAHHRVMSDVMSYDAYHVYRLELVSRIVFIASSSQSIHLIVGAKGVDNSEMFIIACNGNIGDQRLRRYHFVSFGPALVL